MTNNYLENVVSIEDLTSYLTNIIIQVRSSDKSLDSLRKNINKLKIYENLTKENTTEELFNAYKQIQKTSMELRKVLNQFTSIEIYDTIDYAFYYNGQQYYTDEIKAHWLTKSSKSGELKLRLNTATKELQQDVVDSYRNRIRDIFKYHQAVFSAAIEGTYRGIIGRGGALNRGHIAEAYEIHIAEHHPVEYLVLKGLKTPSNKITAIDQTMIAQEGKMNAVQYWANHEGISSAWEHVKEALGTQRGTVAGDVGSTQVKQGKTGASRIRLARLNTLQEGIESYTMILNENIPPQEVALKIARYISEPVNKISSKIVDNITDEETKKIFQNFNDNLIQHIMVKL